MTSMQRTAALEDARAIDGPTVASLPEAVDTVPGTGPLRPVSILVMVAGAILVVVGAVTWFVVRDQLADEKIVVSADAPFLGGDDVDGPFSAYAESRAIHKHALEMSGGLTYAEMDREDPTRQTIATASFLRASLLTSVVAFGVAGFALGLGILLILIGWALLRIDRVLRAPGWVAAPTSRRFQRRFSVRSQDRVIPGHEESSDMHTWMRRTRGRGARWAVVGIASFLAAGGLASRASAEHSLLEHVSTGPAGGNGVSEPSFAGASVDGGHVFFITGDALVSADTDMRSDVYERSGGQTTLVSTGPAGGNGDFLPGYSGASADGGRVFFQTQESLVTTDTDTTFDVYERAGGQTTLVSTAPTGGTLPAAFAGASADGTRVFFRTSERLVSTDTDNFLDVYERAGGQTTLVTTGSASGIGAAEAGFLRASVDGTRVFFTTVESLVTADGDQTSDVYERSGGQTTLVSTGLNSVLPVFFAGASADGTRVFLSTEAKLVSTDTDAESDVYERSGGQTTLVSSGPNGGNGAAFSEFVGASADGSRVLFRTVESLVSTDTDGFTDVYERSGGQTTLVSTSPTGGNGAFHTFFKGASADGSRVYFESAEALVSTDTDGQLDVYERASGQTTLISTGPTGGNGTSTALFRGASADGGRVFFVTNERLVSADTDMASDVYERAAGKTTLVSTGPTGGNGAFEVKFEGASIDGTRVYLATAESLMSTDTDTVADLYVKRIVAPVNTTRPAISGTALVGRRLTCSSGRWDHNPTRLTYRWNRAGVAISGATSSTYTLVAADGARPITCTVTASNSAGSRSATSAAVIPRFPGPCANPQTGGAGPDRLTGLALGDRLLGLGGNDVLIGLAGDDCLTGGTGNDTLRGDTGVDRFDGGAGNDAINSRDGRRETVTCGTGRRDRVTADRVDRLVGCERIVRWS